MESTFRKLWAAGEAANQHLLTYWDAYDSVKLLPSGNLT